MSYYRPVNTGEGELYLVPGIGCPSPFEKLRICECGAITFLDGPCRICHKSSMKPISRTLEKQFFNDIAKKRRHQSFILLLYGAMAAMYLVFLLYLFANQQEYELGLIKKALLVIVSVYITGTWILQIFTWFGTASTIGKTRKYKFGNQVTAAYVLAFSDSPFTKAGGKDSARETWLNVVLQQYKSDISYLESQFEEVLTSENRRERLLEIYYAALKLSYVLDNKDLALLRLRCYSEIGLHQNAHCDIEQILHILPPETIKENPAVLSQIEKCLDSYSEPLSKWTVCCLMNDLKYFMEASSDPEIVIYREIIKKCIAHCSGGKVRWFLRNYADGEWAEPTRFSFAVLEENSLFKMQFTAET